MNTKDKKWIVHTKKADFTQIANELGISPVLARIIRNRDVIGVEKTRKFIRAGVACLHSPSLLPDIDKAAAIILDAIKKHTKIRIVGDYDVDGICSTYILWKVFSAMGADVDTVLPHRIRDGYGISENMVQAAHEDGIGLIVTCDNGIAASGPLRLAKNLGMRVVVTDHHEIPFEETASGPRYVLPPADAVVDPKVRDAKNPYHITKKPSYPFPDICGAAVALKLCMHMRNMAGPIPGIDQANEKELWTEAETFCALATVCDVMPLQDENRVMVKRGLAFAKRTKNVGLQALLNACGLTGKPVTCYHAGFILGPCMNASGRLDTAELALGMFRETDPKAAAKTAQKLHELNEERKAMTQAGLDEALRVIDNEGLFKDTVLVVHLPDCHESLAGIIAGKIREYYYKPVLVFTGHGTLKGSGRSIEAYHMYNSLSRHRDMLLKFGGHAMAAGMSIEEKMLPEFRRIINKESGLSEDDLTEKLYVDMKLPPSLLDIRTVEEFDMLEPCGTKNPKPMFAESGIHLEWMRVLGKNQNVMKFRGSDRSGRALTFMRFGEPSLLQDALRDAGIEEQYSLLQEGKGEVMADIVYYPEINEWNDTRSLQFIIKDWKLKGGRGEAARRGGRTRSPCG